MQELKNGEALIIKSSLFAKILLSFVLLIFDAILFLLIFLSIYEVFTAPELFNRLISILFIAVLVIIAYFLHIFVINVYKERYLVDFDNLTFIGFRKSIKIMYSDIKRVEMGRINYKAGRMGEVIVHSLDTKISLPLLRITGKRAQQIVDLLIRYDPNYSK